LKRIPLTWLAAATIGAGVLATAAVADDRADIDRTKIIGNRELPKVLYIVPWKKPAPGDLSGVPAESVLDEALAPVDRDVFRRQVHYDGLVQPGAVVRSAEPAAVAQPAPSQK
jgi:hypothetical protein